MPKRPSVIEQFIGPTGTFHSSGKINNRDRGVLGAGFARLPDQRLYVMQFGIITEWVALDGALVKQFAQTIRERISRDFGPLAYDTSTLPIKVTGNKEKQVIIWTFSPPCSDLIANPEVWLALIEVTEARLKEISS